MSIRWAAHVNASCDSHHLVEITESFIIRLRRSGKVEDWDACRYSPGSSSLCDYHLAHGLSNTALFFQSWQAPRCWSLLGGSHGVRDTQNFTWCCARRMSATVMTAPMRPPIKIYSTDTAFRPTVDVSSCRKLHSISVEGLHHCYIGPKLRVQGRHMVALTRCLCETAARKA